MLIVMVIPDLVHRIYYVMLSRNIHNEKNMFQYGNRDIEGGKENKFDVLMTSNIYRSYFSQVHY